MSDDGRHFDGFSDAESYRAEVDRSIAFAHAGHDMYVRAKAQTLQRFITDRFGRSTDLEIVDVGCGVGAMQKYVAPIVGRSVGIEPHEATAQTARLSCPDSEIISTDGKGIPCENNSFDLAFAVNVLHHVDRAEHTGFISEMIRVTRSGGFVVIFEHNPLNPLTRLAVHRCAFDIDVKLVSRRRAHRLLSTPTTVVVEERYLIFFPIDRDWARGAERQLGWLPLGAQYMVAARVD